MRSAAGPSLDRATHFCNTGEARNPSDRGQQTKGGCSITSHFAKRLPLPKQLSGGERASAAQIWDMCDMTFAAYHDTGYVKVSQLEHICGKSKDRVDTAFMVNLDSAIACSYREGPGRIDNPL